MQLIILKENLKRALQHVDKAVNPNAMLPILKNILIKTFNGKIKFASNNLEIGVNAYILGKIIEEGAITVPHSVLTSIVNNIQNEKVILEVEKNVLHVKTDNYKAKIQGIGEKEFPLIPKVENTEEHIEFTGDVLKQALPQILPAIQLSNIKPEISGMCMNFQLNHVKLAGTDTFRLVEKTLSEKDFQSRIFNTFQVIIPLNTIQELVKIIHEGEKVKFFFSANQVAFHGEDWELISRVIDGAYPEYDFIIPKEVETEISADKEDFVHALKLTSNFSGKINDIKLKTEDKKILKMYSSNAYLGENEYMMPVKVQGKDLEEVIFNWRYLADVDKIFDQDELVLGFNGPDKPAIFKSGKDKSVFYILMPIKLT